MVIKPLNQEDYPLAILEDLGMQFATAEEIGRKYRYATFECPDCKTHIRSKVSHIKGKLNPKCRACANTTHGLRTDTLYSTWSNQKNRCTNPKAEFYPNYGGRGIKMSDEFFNNFTTWYTYVTALPDYAVETHLSLDRIDNNKDYTRGNLRWASPQTQGANTVRLRSNNTSGYRGVSFDIPSWKAEIGINNKRIRLGVFSCRLAAAYAYDEYILLNKLPHTTNGLIT